LKKRPLPNVRLLALTLTLNACSLKAPVAGSVRRILTRLTPVVLPPTTRARQLAGLPGACSNVMLASGTTLGSDDVMLVIPVPQKARSTGTRPTRKAVSFSQVAAVWPA
jgi:hypothetical protein